MNDLLRWAARYGVQRIMWRAPWWVVGAAIVLYLIVDQAHASALSTTSAADIGDLRAAGVHLNSRAPVSAVRQQ